VPDRLEELEAEAVRLARGPGIASTVPSERECDRSAARERLLKLQKESGLSRREFAEELLACDESALRLAAKGAGLPLPWWLERLLRERPELVASFAAALLKDVRVSIARRTSNG
jgi:hypothetical protein